MTERYDCHYCKESLFGKKYVLREDNPYCVKCYESLYSNTCEECKKPIGCNTRVSDWTEKETLQTCTGWDCVILATTIWHSLQDLSYKDRHWHEDCFKCFQCKRSLVDKPFSTKDEQLLCTECYSNEYSSKCHECKKTIMPGKKESKYAMQRFLDFPLKSFDVTKSRQVGDVSWGVGGLVWTAAFLA